MALITLQNLSDALIDHIPIPFEDSASASESKYYVPEGGHVIQIAAVAHGDPGADRTITVKRNATTVGTVVVANGASENDVSFLSSGNFSVDAGDVISFENDGGGANSVKMSVTMSIQQGG